MRKWSHFAFHVEKALVWWDVTRKSREINTSKVVEEIERRRRRRKEQV